MFLAKREPQPDPVPPAPVMPPVAAQPAVPPTVVDMPRRTDAPSIVTSSRPAVPAPAAQPADAKRLIVGEGISLSGEITACDRLVVEGSARVTLNQTRAIEITETGRFTEGKAEVDEAEVSGVYEGELTVRKRLLIRHSGQVRGTVRYGEIEIEKGGVLSGSVSMLPAKT
ncbi:MAG: polymer-forming cytoskeletal protein [Geminicoccaceae bacterium]